MLPVRRGLVLRGRLSASMKGGLNGYSVAWLFATMTLSSGLPGSAAPQCRRTCLPPHRAPARVPGPARVRQPFSGPSSDSR